jgi:hypothetical protein
LKIQLRSIHAKSLTVRRHLLILPRVRLGEPCLGSWSARLTRRNTFPRQKAIFMVAVRRAPKNMRNSQDFRCCAHDDACAMSSHLAVSNSRQSMANLGDTRSVAYFCTEFRSPLGKTAAFFFYMHAWLTMCHRPCRCYRVSTQALGVVGYHIWRYWRNQWCRMQI